MPWIFRHGLLNSVDQRSRYMAIGRYRQRLVHVLQSTATGESAVNGKAPTNISYATMPRL